MDHGKRCSTCQLWRPLSDYSKRARSPDGLQARCRACCRLWYLANQDDHKRNVRRRNDRVRQELQALLRDHLLTHPCAACGEPDVRVLEFDHRDPVDKSEAVGRLVGASMSSERVLTEMTKCDVLCANCHRVRTMDDCRSWRTPAEQERREADRARALQRLDRVLPA